MRIVVTGATGQLGHFLIAELQRERAHNVEPWGRRAGPGHWNSAVTQLDLTDSTEVTSALDRADPDVILHAAAISTADSVRKHPEAAWEVNVNATSHLARWCRERGRRLVFTSTDMVFDGLRSPYRETDPTAPILEYGRTKAAAEKAVAETPHGLIVRLSLLYGPALTGTPSFFDRAMSDLKAGRTQTFFEDEYRTPLAYITAARAVIELSALPVNGIVHVGGKERLSRVELMTRVAAALGIDTKLIHANRIADVTFTEPRPADLSLDTTKLESLLPGLVPRSVEDAMARFR